ncbi:MAG: DDE-type integrase/transposase/recombinase, partial [Bacteroidota bacterium]
MGDVELEDVYYDVESTGGYGGVARLRKAANTGKTKTDAWLAKQRTYTLHKPARLRYATRPYKTAAIDQQWQADLVEMIPYENENDGYRYLLTVIDLFSRHAWAKPIKNKTGKEVKRAFQEIFASGRKPQRLQTDEGLEFANRHVQHLLNMENIRFFTVKSQFKAAVCERFNRTLKSKMWRYFTRMGNYRWIHILPDLLTAYNNSVHRSIGMAPSNVTQNVQHELWEKQEAKGPQKVSGKEPKTRFQVGDQVRLSKAKQVFAKGYLPNWTEEIFTVSQVLNTVPAQYKVRDYR